MPDPTSTALSPGRRGEAPEPLAAALLATLASWSGSAAGGSQADDVTLVVLAVGEPPSSL